MTKAKLMTIFLAAAIAMPIFSAAQTTASGTLAVSATLQSSISMVFNTDAAGVALGSAGTNAATLNFGNISAYGTLASNVTRSVGASTFTVSTPFDVLVQKANSASASYSLTAQLNAADATNGWALGGSTVGSGSATTLTASGTYGSATAYSLALTVPLSSGAPSISNTINFVATAN
jgi:hypothetical protein